MGKTITVPTRELASVAKWASQDQGRPDLCAVLFARGEYVACDGHRMVRVPCETNGLTFAVDRIHLLAACAAQVAIPGADQIELELDGKAHVRIGVGLGVSMLVPLRDPATYPPIEKVMPNEKGSLSLNGYVLDPRYLAAIAEINEANAPKAKRGVKVVAWSPTDEHGNRTGAMLLENCNGVRFIVMPMRCV